MNDTLNSGKSDEATAARGRLPVSRRWQLRRVINVAMPVCVGVVLLVLAVRYHGAQRTAPREIATVTTRRDELRALDDRLQADEKQAEADRRVIDDVLRNCRDADDIPDFGGPRIVFYSDSLKKLCLYVPEGDHTLEISCTWQPSPTVGPMANVVADDGVEQKDANAEAGPSDKETWKVPLLPASGYWLAFTTDRPGEPIQWVLTGNHPDFETQTKTVSLDGASYRHLTWRGWKVELRFPNEINRWKSIAAFEAAATSPPGVSLMSATVRSPRGEGQYDVTIAARLLSETPACVSASTALYIIAQRREDLLLPYEGGGKYDLNVPTVDAER